MYERGHETRRISDKQSSVVGVPVLWEYVMKHTTSKNNTECIFHLQHCSTSTESFYGGIELVCTRFVERGSCAFARTTTATILTMRTCRPTRRVSNCSMVSAVLEWNHFLATFRKKLHGFRLRTKARRSECATFLTSVCGACCTVWRGGKFLYVDLSLQKGSLTRKFLLKKLFPFSRTFPEGTRSYYRMYVAVKPDSSSVFLRRSNSST